VRPSGIAGEGSGDRRRDDDAPAPAGGERRQCGLDDVDGALEVDADHLLDVLGGEVLEAARWEDARVGAHDVQAAVALHCGGDDALAVLGTGHIGGESAHAARLAGQGRDGGVDVVGIAAGHNDVDARIREDLGDAAADALATAGDDGRSALQ
jgi:hypothetical protein